jgi:Tol biopolymer transport system component
VTAARKALVLCLSLAPAACGDGADPGTGTVEVITVSGGSDVDPDGYTVHLAGARAETVPANGSVTFAGVTAGDHEVRLTGVRGNCAIPEAHPRLVRVSEGEIMHTRFEVVCAHAPLLGRLVYAKIDPSVEREVNGDLYIMTPDGSSQHRITSTVLVESHASIAPDGARILFQGADYVLSDVRNDFDLYVMNADGTGLVALTTDERADDLEPAWSPDGSVIAFTSDTPHPDESSDRDIYLINPDGTGLVNITRSPSVWENSPRWSPDGARILFHRVAESSSGLFVMNADGTLITPLTSDHSPAGKGSWSPDGSRIVFEAFVAEQESYDLFLIDADGSDRVRLTDLPGAELNPSWSQDGTRIVFQYLPPDYTYWGPVKSEVYVIHADGAELTNVSKTPDTNESLGANPWGP